MSNATKTRRVTVWTGRREIQPGVEYRKIQSNGPDMFTITSYSAWDSGRGSCVGFFTREVSRDDLEVTTFGREILAGKF